LGNWKVARFGHASKGKGNTRINNEIKDSLSRKRITVSMQYIPNYPKPLSENPSEAYGIQNRDKEGTRRIRAQDTLIVRRDH
jgi:hypothetical protein